MTNFSINFDYDVTSISSCPADLLRFTDLKAFSNYSKVRSLYSIFFSSEYKISKCFRCLLYLAEQIWPYTGIKNLLLNSSAMWLLFFIALTLTFIDLGNLLELSLLFPVISFIICYVCLMSFWESLSKDRYYVC